MLVNFKACIAARRLRQADIAYQLKIGPTMLSQIVLGRRGAEPWLRTRLAEILRANEAWLFAEVVEIPAPDSPLKIETLRGHNFSAVGV